MKTKKYKTLKGLMKALNRQVWTVLDMNCGTAWFPNEEKTCKFELPDEVMDEFYRGCCQVIYRHPKEWQIRQISYVNAGIFRRLWWNGRRYEYCAGQDYPSEIRCIQGLIRKGY